jgi:DNA-binding transcriptional LysR family regulator
VITFRQLEIFAATVSHGSFRRGAEHLGISAEAISANIRTLEDRLGYPLFDRHSGGPATLTERGESAHHFVSNILDDLGHLYDGSDRTAPHKIVVGAHPYIMRHLQAGVDAFREAHPASVIELDIDSGSALSFTDKVKRRMVDLGYYFSFDEVGRILPIVSDLVGQEALAIFVASDHPLTAKRGVAIADLTTLPIIQLSPRTSLRPLLDRALAAYGLGGSSVAVETDDYGHILTSVRRGQGYVCMFASAQDEGGEISGLTRLVMQIPLPSLQILRASRSLHRGALVTELEAQLRTSFAS